MCQAAEARLAPKTSCNNLYPFPPSLRAPLDLALWVRLKCRGSSIPSWPSEHAVALNRSDVMPLWVLEIQRHRPLHGQSRLPPVSSEAVAPALYSEAVAPALQRGAENPLLSRP